MKQLIRFKYLVLAGLILFAFPQVALANVGTPLMWMGVWRLLFINILIGVGEGLAIALIFKSRIFRTIGIMLLANYFSWVVGEIALLPLAAKYGERILGDQPLYNVVAFCKYLVAVAFVLSIVLEFPFCFWAIFKKRWRIPKSIISVVAVNLVSYAAIVWIYSGVSGTTIITNLTMEPSLDFAASKQAWVYYISKDYALYKIRIDGTERQQLLNPSEIRDKGFQEPQSYDYPYIRLSAFSSQETGHWDLRCSVDDESVILLEAFASKSSIKVRGRKESYGDLPSGSVDDVATLANSEWTVHTGYWAFEGLRAEKGDTRKWLALELPFLHWYSRFATVLPGDQIVYQLGNQIVLLDLNADKIGLITMGYGPVVILENKTEEPD